MSNTRELMSTMGAMTTVVSSTDIYDLYTNTLSDLTKVNYVSTIRNFFGVSDLHEISIQDIQSVTPDVVNYWANKQLSEGIAKSTINRKLSAMYNFYEYLCRRNVGVMTYNPFSTSQGAIRFKNALKDYSDKRVLSTGEIREMLKSAAKDKTILGVRDLLVLQLLITTGMRRAELCGIRIGDIGVMGGKHFANILGKGNKHRMIMVADHVYELIKKYLDMRGVKMQDKDLPLIISHSSNADQTKHVDTSTIYRIVKKHAEAAGLDASTIACHNLRHTFATTAYDELGVHKDQLQTLLGHTSSSTTQRYIHTVDMLKSSPAEQLSEMYKI